MLRIIEEPKEENNLYFGKDCPKGKVQLEFIGFDKDAKVDDYHYKPTDDGFLEIYIDGQRFRIDVGTFESPNGKRRGLHIVTGDDIAVDKHSINSVDVYLANQ